MCVSSVELHGEAESGLEAQCDALPDVEASCCLSALKIVGIRNRGFGCVCVFREGCIHTCMYTYRLSCVTFAALLSHPLGCLAKSRFSLFHLRNLWGSFATVAG